MFKDVQTKFVKKADCKVSVVDEQGPLVCVKVEKEKLVNDTILCVPYDVHFDRSTQEVRCECNLFERSVYKVPSCYVLPRWSKKISARIQFVGDDDETTLLHVALEETRAKFAAHRAKKRSESVSETHTNIGSQSSNDVGVDDIQGPSKVTTKGRPKSKRLGAALEKSFKNSTRRKHNNSSSVVRPHASQDVNHGAVAGLNVPKQAGCLVQDVNHGAVAGLNVPEQAGGFMSLLSVTPSLLECHASDCATLIARSITTTL
ncbi:hypothetical protein AHAS_Ahas11G0149100 [Arachis hypogaea]